jgi:hypothetical protein
MTLANNALNDPVGRRLLGEATTDSLTVEELIGYGASLVGDSTDPASRAEAALALWSLACEGLVEFLLEYPADEGRAFKGDAYGIWSVLNARRTPGAPAEDRVPMAVARQWISRLIPDGNPTEGDLPLRCYATAEGRRAYESRRGTDPT